MLRRTFPSDTQVMVECFSPSEPRRSRTIRGFREMCQREAGFRASPTLDWESRVEEKPRPRIEGLHGVPPVAAPGAAGGVDAPGAAPAGAAVWGARAWGASACGAACPAPGTD